MQSEPIKTSCLHCGVGCGAEVGRDADGAIEVRGDIKALIAEASDG